ncbi:pilus assembly protein TadG-related protein [Oceanimonas smirnovii]|uniref:pilus assembly protein TadG-related protein n=1 Tax=Oceanimonas smirnovii TaxID=264574 RepID=UPI003FD56C0F
MTTLRRCKQGGAFTLIAAGTLLLTLGCTMLVLDTGRLYMEQRKLQKLADTAALESIARLNSGRCADAPDIVQTYAQENATRNGFLAQDSQSIATQCVRIDISDSLRTPVADASGHAVRTIAKETVPASLLFRAGNMLGITDKNEVNLQASAVAEREGGAPTATFSIGAELLRLDNSRLIGQVLNAVGVNAGTLAILNSNALADINITPAGLLKRLGVDVSIYELKALSPQGLVELVNTEVGVLGIDRLIGTSAELVSDNVLKTDLEALQVAVLQNPLLQDVQLPLFSTADNPGLISLASTLEGNVGPALDAAVNLGDLLGTSILLGTSERALEIPGLNTLGLAKVQLGIVEPPTIAVGPVGTRAYNGQIRLYADIDSNNLLGGVLSWLTDSVLGLRVRLPLTVDVTTAHAEFMSAQCTENPPAATFEVNSALLNTCIGSMPEASRWSGSVRCEESLQPAEMIKLLHFPVLTGKTHIEGLSYIGETEPLTEGTLYNTLPNNLPLGNTTDNIVLGLLDLLGGLFRPPSIVNNSDLDYSEKQKNMLIDQLATQYLDATKVNGFYNVGRATDLILNGSTETDPNTGAQLVPPLAGEDWFLAKSIPTSWGLGATHPSQWQDGSFSEAFYAYTSKPYGLLDVVGIPTLGNGYWSCAGLLSSLLSWNQCVDHNLTRLLQTKPGGIDLSASSDADSLLNLGSDTFSCSGSGLLCVLLKPVLNLLKPVLNGVGELLTTVLDEVLGLDVGRSDLHLQELNCGAPRLVN